MKIGIPKGLYFYYHQDFLIKFFNYLKCDIIFSSDTNQKIIEEGSKITPSEICLPIKAFFGHIKDLLGKCDYLFLIRFVKKYINKQPLFGCPKFIGLPDLVKAAFDNLSVLELTIDEEIKSEEEGYSDIFKKLDFSKREILTAYQKAKEKIEEERIREGDILVIGHPYVLFDNRLSLNLLDILKKMEIKFITSFQFFKNDFDKEKEVCWYYHRHLLYSAYWAKEKGISGIIIINNFPCGTQPIIDEKIKKICKDLNILQLIIDEHSQKEGFITRLESFFDLLKIKNR